MTRPVMRVVDRSAEAHPVESARSAQPAPLNGCICCPCCGARPKAEFERIEGPTPAPALDASARAWFNALYLADVARPAVTYWRHAQGCGMAVALSAAGAEAVSQVYSRALERLPAPKSQKKRSAAKPKARGGRARRKLAS